MSENEFSILREAAMIADKAFKEGDFYDVTEYSVTLPTSTVSFLETAVLVFNDILVYNSKEMTTLSEEDIDSLDTKRRALMTSRKLKAALPQNEEWKKRPWSKAIKDTTDVTLRLRDMDIINSALEKPIMYTRQTASNETLQTTEKTREERILMDQLRMVPLTDFREVNKAFIASGAPVRPHYKKHFDD